MCGELVHNMFITLQIVVKLIKQPAVIQDSLWLLGCEQGGICVFTLVTKGWNSFSLVTMSITKSFVVLF